MCEHPALLVSLVWQCAAPLPMECTLDPGDFYRSFGLYKRSALSEAQEVLLCPAVSQLKVNIVSPAVRRVIPRTYLAAEPKRPAREKPGQIQQQCTNCRPKNMCMPSVSRQKRWLDHLGGIRASPKAVSCLLTHESECAMPQSSFRFLHRHFPLGFRSIFRPPSAYVKNFAGCQSRQWLEALPNKGSEVETSMFRWP
ncbi:hypothetical protein BS50DRAFT_114516 [Corynespora cassiicola Philippines]|uniref:Secreted protein n=1 Tax=Corynespora cassiicola Philippines TaxID=1448308 RepID=A0A2T2NDH0_CORCC|nr:hypothetical protein BS50DRAFT_114516 [Corynespora cassiicola Philippines]